MTDLERIEELKRTGKRLSFSEARAILEEANERGETREVVYHLAETKELKAWAYKNGIKTDSEAYELERTYYGGSDQKAFKSGMGGYSIFAQCEANIKAGGWPEVERIERLAFDWVIIA